MLAWWSRVSNPGSLVAARSASTSAPTSILAAPRTSSTRAVPLRIPPSWTSVDSEGGSNGLTPAGPSSFSRRVARWWNLSVQARSARGDPWKETSVDTNRVSWPLSGSWMDGMKLPLPRSRLSSGVPASYPRIAASGTGVAGMTPAAEIPSGKGLSLSPTSATENSVRTLTCIEFPGRKPARATRVWFVNGSSPSAPSLTASRLKPTEAPPRDPPVPHSPLAAECPRSPTPAPKRTRSGAVSDRVTMCSTPPMPFDP